MSSQDTEGDEEVSAFFRNVQEIRAEEVLPTEIMDKLKKLEDSVENLKKLEHSMGLIFQQLKNLENSIAPQAIISAPMSSYAVPSASISSAVPSAPQAIISVASISSAVPSATVSTAVPPATVSTAVPPATVSTAVPPATISAGPSASYQDFLQYRSQHPGPISSRAFYRWSQYGGDDPSFRWRREAPYDTTGRRRGAGKRFNSFISTSSFFKLLVELSSFFIYKEN
ncbi:uncharacterized protein LOC124816866 isoform X5 [Hydra vulgaris]|uniref:uncharacterized protein LOC124816866 isoform X5 n=1 Tax=Hydra vulgaris TaxID=6087 RepID=UPI0032E9E00F